MLSRVFAQFAALTLNALHESVSNSVFYGVLVFAVLAIAATGVVGALSLHQEERLFNDLILFSSVLFLAGVSIYQGVRSLHNEIKSKTIFTVLTKPVSRSSFVIGKYLGALAAIFIALFCIFGLMLGTAAILGYELTVQHLYAYYGLALQLAILLSVTMLFSSFSSPVLSTIFSGAVFLAGSLTPQLREAVSYFAKQESPAKYVAEGAMLILPDFEKLNLSFELTHSLFVPNQYMLAITGYTLAYVGMTLSVTCIIFNQRDLS